MPLRNIPGAVPEPEELVGRDHLLDLLWSQLNGNNILLVAPRRFGKTGIMRHVLKKPRRGYLPAYIDVEDVSSPAGFVTELMAALLEQEKLRKLWSNLKNLPKKMAELTTKYVDELGPDEFKVKLRHELGDAWQTTALKLILVMERCDDTVIFIIDEFAEMVNRISRAKDQGPEAAIELVSWFRKLRLRQKDVLRRFRFIIAGSTSIDMVLRRLDIPDRLNDCCRLAVEPLQREDALRLLDGLSQAHDLRFSDAARAAFFELIGPPVPYFIHLFVFQLISEPTLKGKDLTPEEVTQVYRERLLGPTCHKYFDPYRQRLKKYGPAGERAAVAILRELAASPTGRASDSALYATYREVRKAGASDIEFAEIMADLECDWYVTRDTATNEYFFFLEVMKAWWSRFYPRLDRGAK